MSNKDDGGPAFPIVYTTADDVKPGLSLRDYFAAKAMQGFTAAGADEWPSAEDLAHDAYTVADAMLRERAK